MVLKVVLSQAQKSDSLQTLMHHLIFLTIKWTSIQYVKKEVLTKHLYICIVYQYFFYNRGNYQDIIVAKV
jgi:hypothetical protein